MPFQDHINKKNFRLSETFTYSITTKIKYIANRTRSRKFRNTANVKCEYVEYGRVWILFYSVKIIYL